MSAARFEGLCVLVTGAARGLGRRAAERFAGEGAGLVLCDLDGAALEETAVALAREGAAVETVTGDVGHEETHGALVERALARWRRVDVAVNNAGVAHPFMKLAETDPAVMERMLAVNVMGVFHGLRAQIPVMERQHRETGRGGAILNVSSVAGVVGAPLLAAYAAAKHAVVGLTRSAAGETARRGVRINALCPAFTDTHMVADMLERMHGGADEAEARLVANLPMRRLASPDEIVEAMLFACAPANGFMTGQTLVIDGGLSAV